MIDRIQNIQTSILENNKINSNNKEKNNVFDEMYQAAVALIDDTNQLELEADQKSLEFAMGKNVKIEDVLIAQEKANILLQFTIQVRNKAVESYKEIMRMPL